jgi:nicotinate-nucleotide pyrophosphorylase (carboxylating)
MNEFENTVTKLLSQALQEDVGAEDITTNAIVPKEHLLKGHIIAKEDGRIAGLNVIKILFSQFYKEVNMILFCSDGDSVCKGKRIAEIHGPGRDLLATERLMLNILQRMSGIATQTSRFVERTRGTNAIILDTRKTAPGLRALDKLAVRLGGGTNHRLGLFDSYLIKENHIEAAGSLTEAVRRVQTSNPERKPIEVEVRSLQELQEALGLSVDRILLDNMTAEDMKRAVELTAGRVPLEASGNVTLENIRQVAATGVAFISVGSLTHSVRALDLSFIIEKS